MIPQPFWNLATEKPAAQAAMELAELYGMGRGFERDMVKAVACERKAAALGDSLSPEQRRKAEELVRLCDQGPPHRLPDELDLATVQE